METEAVFHGEEHRCQLFGVQSTVLRVGQTRAFDNLDGDLAASADNLGKLVAVLRGPGRVEEQLKHVAFHHDSARRGSPPRIGTLAALMIAA